MYKKTKNNPFHLSVGAVLTNHDGDVCCHHFTKSIEVVEVLGLNSLYLLMRETIEEDESIPQALHRGLREEFGASGDISQYLGSIVSVFPYQGLDVQKTTLYFHVDCTSFNPDDRDHSDPESVSDIVWMRPDDLIAKMNNQADEINRTDLNESKVIKRYKQYVVA